ncbi:MAG: hypothetical protein L6Q95_10280 [Planctomycetes bacterium]|nr:hypothetical protein [Planctomycetota bacterium]
MTSAVCARTVRFDLPPAPNQCGPEEFFVGIWWPRGDPVEVELPDGVESVGGACWTLAGSRSPLSAARRLLVHKDGRGGIAFRGYIVEPAVHGWCDSKDVLAAWWDRPPAVPNGAFAVARLDDRTGELQLQVDAVGVGSLYYRTWGRAVLFGTSPRYLRLPGDALDAVGWRNRISAGVVTGDDSLIEGIRRVPPGCRVTFSADGSRSVGSFLPEDFFCPAIRPADREATERLESAFVRAVRRCCALPGLSPVLPLSAGFDSRRILATLMQLGVPCEAMTVRVLDTRSRDLDAPYAAQLAALFGIPHHVYDLPGPERYVALDRDRRLLMHGESLHHTWIMDLLGRLPSQPGMVLDGLAGDVLGETGYMIPALVRPDVSDKELCDHLTSPNFESLYRAPFWPARETARARLFEWLATLPRVLRGEWVFLLTRTRREIASWSQRLLPAGHVAVYPYLDLDYLRLGLEIDPVARVQESMQSRCLAAFHPEIAAVPGTHRADDPPRRDLARGRRMRDLMCVRALESDVLAESTPEALREVFPRRYRMLHWAAQRSDSVASRVGWWRDAALEMLHLGRSAVPAWRPAGDARPGKAGR